MPFEETPRRFRIGRFSMIDWGVFYEKAPKVKAALAANLIWAFRSRRPSPSLLSALSRSPSLDSVHYGVPPLRRCDLYDGLRGQDVQRSHRQRGGSTSSSDLPACQSSPIFLEVF